MISPLAPETVPTARDAEFSLIGCAIATPEILATGKVAPADFFLPELGKIWSELQTMAAAKPDVFADFPLFSAELKRRGADDAVFARITEALNTRAAPELWESYAHEVLDASRRRRIIQVAAQATAAAQDPTVPTAETAGRLAAIGVPAPPAFPLIEILSVAKLAQEYPELRRIIIGGLLRVGEVANIIAAPKVGKSWLIHNLCVCLVTGCDFLGMTCEKVRVLLIDNELHKETLVKRLTWVAQQYGLKMADLEGRLDIVSLRGQLRDLHAMGELFQRIERGWYGVILIDSLYRAMPTDTDENSNVDITGLYNLLDRYATQTGAAFVLVHHSSKGIQGGKSITDVGSGAGAQSRAADVHIILRPHQEEGVIVLDAVNRSFAPIQPSCWRLEVPNFLAMPDLDPTLLKSDRKPRKSAVAGFLEAAKPELTPTDFAAKYIPKDVGMELVEIQVKAADTNLTDRAIDTLVRKAVAMGNAYKWPGGPGKPTRYSQTPMPIQEAAR